MQKGTFVICVDDSEQFVTADLCVRKGQIYTVRDSYTFLLFHAVLLEEIRRPEMLHFEGSSHEVGFLSFRFRPIDPEEISIFREIVEITNLVSEGSHG